MTPPKTMLPLAFAVALCGCGSKSETASAPAAKPAATAPSILLVSLDTTRADHLGCYGDGRAATPNIDRWAAEGVVFDHAATPVPITLPAHASLLTGLLPNHHGVRDNGLYRVPDDVTTLAELLSAAGYNTAAVVGAAVLDRQYGLAQGFARYDDDVQQGGGLAIAERPAAAVTDAALAIAADLRPPFFLWVHYFDPHAAYQPPPPFAETFRERPYDGEIAYVDRELGRLRAGLDARGGLANAIVAIVADHGESLGEHGEPSHGVFLYQSTVRVPWILVAPGRLPAGARRAALAPLIDVAPTLLDLAGLSVPSGIDGRSLVTLAAGSTPDAAAAALPLETDFGYDSYGFAPLRGLLDGRVKWIGAPKPELYDLAADPREQDNLARTRNADVERLRAAWTAAVRVNRVAEPPGGGSPEEEARRISELSSLGYVSASARGPARGRLPDPKDAIGTLQDITDARGALAAGRHADAERLLSRVIERTPQNLSALILLGSARIDAGRPAGAVAPLESAVRLAPFNADAQFNLGLARLGKGDAAGAEQAWRATLRLAPRYHDAAVNLVDLLQQTHRAAEASAVLNEARARGLDSAVLDYLAGRLAFQRGETLTAREALRRALSRPLPPQIAADARAMLARLGG